jgi:hypothetical protein
MRIAPWWVAGLAFGLAAHAEAPANKPTSKEMTRMLLEMMQWESEWRKKEHISKRAEELRPAYRAEPLRYLNITDEEVREVQSISVKHLPRAMMNISPVVTDCPCEEGPNCTAQVYVVAAAGEKSKGLQLSRLKNQWMVGVVQQWWLRREAMHVPKPGAELPERYRYAKALQELFSDFPVCTRERVPAKTTASTQKAEPKK